MKNLEMYVASEAAKTLWEQLDHIEEREMIDPQDIKNALERYHRCNSNYVLKKKLRGLIANLSNNLFKADGPLEDRIKDIEIKISEFEELLYNKKIDD